MPDVSSPPLPLAHGRSTDEWTAAHERLKANDASWQSLAFDGIQHNGCGELIEYRRCPCCQSTLGRPISAAAALSLCQEHAALYGRSAEAVLSALYITATVSDGRRRREDESDAR